jgi:hypothetical protein
VLTSARLGSLCVSGSASVTLWCRRKTKTEWHTAKLTLFGHKQAALVSLSLSLALCLAYMNIDDSELLAVHKIANFAYEHSVFGRTTPSV